MANTHTGTSQILVGYSEILAIVGDIVRVKVPEEEVGQSTALLPSVSPTIDWVQLPQRFPVRIQVDGSAPIELRIGQTVSVAISHGSQSAAFHNRLTSIGFGRLPTHSDR